MEAKNPFLNKVNATIRRERPPTPESLSYTIWSGPGEESLYAAIWFRTQGCRFDYRGQCTMCDYWVSSQVSSDQMIAAVREAISSLNPFPSTLVITPSGSLFDEWEVPSVVRQAIFGLVNDVPCDSYFCETRPELVTLETMCEYRDVIKNKFIGIEMGLESANPLVLRYCVNKTLSLPGFVNAVNVAHQYGVHTIANVLVGSAFLSPSEAIGDAVSSVLWALDNGIDNCIVFPVHVKPYTLLQWMWEHDLYSSPSLWSLVEVLRQLGPGISRRVYISWYRAQYKESHIQHGKRSTRYPTTCPRCLDKVLVLLDQYRHHEDYEAIEALVRMECICKDVWRETVETPPQHSLVERIAQYYEIIGQGVLGTQGWREQLDKVLFDLQTASVPSSIPPSLID